ncbi:hypothetical protein ACO22_06279 [Paracoccidioides brasiliensis]|uniref:Mitochondrial outer membrane protein n=1 Tax=Paracoccidioides brasiliensis TaxID=121759 RepID=A0A1D2J7Z6_PARBR|nr:hypothetical protein ACO22_06279 [Paracoccidioides brasiliensis]
MVRSSTRRRLRFNQLTTLGLTAEYGAPSRLPTVLSLSQCTSAMPEDDAAASSQAHQSVPGFATRFPSVPAPIKCVFDKFPLRTYPPTELPQRIPRQSDKNSLFVFTTTKGARPGAPSFNPQCLKWQAYLKFVGIPFETVASNNHASPTGSLPFLLPALSSAATSGDPPLPVPSNKIQKWALEQTHVKDDPQLSSRFDVYMSLLDHRVRNAWIYTFYIDNQNFNNIGRKLYIDPSTSNTIVRAMLAHQLQQAARDELLKSSSFVDVDDLEAEAKSAFQALSTLLGEDYHFFGNLEPGLFDASVFAYTHLLLDEQLGWKHNPLGRYLRKCPNLVQHRQRLLEAYF